MRTRSHRFGSLAAALLSTVVLAIPAGAQRAARPIPATSVDEGAWQALDVPGGAAALASLGVVPERERGAIVVELIRRLHFSKSPPLELESAILDLSLAATDFDTLRNAIAIASPTAQPPSLALAADKKQRKKLADALEALGLELKESKKQFRAELRGNERAVALRKRLSSIGIDAAALRQALNGGAPLSIDLATVQVPLPLSSQTWSKVIFEREIPARQLFVEIMKDPSARLLYHGLAGLDAGTRRWMATQPDLLRRIFKDQEAVRAFSLFGPAIRVSGGRVVVPGGAVGERRWSAVLDAEVAKPDRFIRRLIDHNSGRTSGLYFTVAAVDAPRQRFLLGGAEAGEAGNQRFERLVASFANCYPSTLIFYPFRLRSHDAALMLLEIGITEEGRLAGPAWKKFWQLVFDGDSLPDNAAGSLRDVKEDGLADAAWLVDTLCGASPEERGSVFTTVLAGHRVFAGIPDAELPNALVALRARRLYPALFMALELARIEQPRTYAVIARHAAKLAHLDDRERSVTALRLFQGALALTLDAATAGTFARDAERLVQSLAEVAFEKERYDGRIAEWLVQKWLPAARTSLGRPAGSAEDLVARALAGPVPVNPQIVRWEGQEYAVDVSADTLRRLLEVRTKQGGLPLDAVIELYRIAASLRQTGITLEGVKDLRADLLTLAPRLRSAGRADEYLEEGPNVDDKVADVARELGRIDEPRDLKRADDAGVDLSRSIDFLLADVLASWVYTPHLGEIDSGALIGADPAQRHMFGLGSAGRAKVEQRWNMAMPLGDIRAVNGSLFGLQAGLANWSLRRLAADRLPPRPTIGGNDLVSFMLTASLSEPRQLDDTEMARIAAAINGGSQAIASAGLDAERLTSLAARAAMSPWRREALSWIAERETTRLGEQFSISERARLGGITAADARDWGSVSIVTGCLCLQMPPTRIPEVIVGRSADGLLGGQSADLMLRIAVILAELKMPASLAAPVMGYAMRDFLDGVDPLHEADFDAFRRRAQGLARRQVEDYLGAIAAIGPLRPVEGVR